ncbi:twin-arginine translocase subunit TatC [Pseudoxanthomonas winnipegensis]|jgi:sec-independent protein translocase protein TatC|uniref:Sec-independent protein translocase protein TatC n=1 Tax=Pseudoxanthomonas winnipegensis TaxID=2480810 RepID=A0A4Q8LNV1_9GAMM|nr:twin-arginine translocase subunit TatC [Pseudoxanthomonas winnipegensis]RZZ89696.1 twin-arginine translocase subunit TatC [Pseudoxanthomonas winnipegensis]TAA09788.1 twin-arginine translocase subunit TatC [Pseudoxanthomonas winnipegensis]TAA22832.1 twin-arginine translocase subunit TatC [Pseudoxanthomonas winnipegensis]TAA32878.1 twin-arginine translocase subunit TatC [Pseudoxanthomonas winnipegensis]TAA43122.1 twin-arginine translocase subunit TatC [Pseudoxanthomonas winnipegensis]
MNAPVPDRSEHEAESSLMEHLLELRTRLIRGLAGVALVLVIAMPFAKRIFEHLARPLLSQLPVEQAAKMIAADPTSGFFAPIKLAFYLALFVSSPWLIYQAWCFVAPGLYRHEKRLAVPLLVSSIALFFAGCAFAYFAVLPAVFHALTLFTPDVVTLAPDPAKYLDFVVVIFLAFGLSFELPVAMVIVVAVGLVTPQQLKESRGYAIVGVFIIAAIITPPDVVSQLMLALPMCLLYELGILACRWVLPRKAAQA